MQDLLHLSLAHLSYHSLRLLPDVNHIIDYSINPTNLTSEVLWSTRTGNVRDGRKKVIKIEAIQRRNNYESPYDCLCWFWSSVGFKLSTKHNNNPLERGELDIVNHVLLEKNFSFSTRQEGKL